MGVWHVGHYRPLSPSRTLRVIIVRCRWRSPKCRARCLRRSTSLVVCVFCRQCGTLSQSRACRVLGSRAALPAWIAHNLAILLRFISPSLAAVRGVRSMYFANVCWFAEEAHVYACVGVPLKPTLNDFSTPACFTYQLTSSLEYFFRVKGKGFCV